MPAITFFEQQRRDGGIRTGMDVDGETMMSRFKPGRTESDPALVWYVDVTCEGPRIPRRPEQALEWFFAHERSIGKALEALAQRVPAGIDPVTSPMRKQGRIGAATRITITCSAVRRPHAQRIASILRELASHLRERLESLNEVEV